MTVPKENPVCSKWTQSAAAISVGVATLLLSVSDAAAAGLYFAERGVRPLGRGGAFVAGADDLHAIWYNPAGLFDAGTQLLIDASYLHYTTDYTRRAFLEQVDPNTGEVVSEHEQQFGTVHGSSAPIPIPTLGGSYRLNDKWAVALAVEAPYAAITSYPDTLNGEPAPQRYGLLTLEGSALALIGGWAAYAPNEQWRIGAGLQVLVGKFQATTMFSACVPERFFCAPEQPSFDTLGELVVGPLFTPSGNIGAIYRPHRQWRVGAAFQVPFFVRAPAEIHSRLPSAPVFETASQEGEDATVSFELPWSARLGVEFAPVDELKLELDVSFEGWAMHDAIRVEPENVKLRNVVGFPDPYGLPEQTIVRGFQNTFSLRSGGEWDIPIGGTVLQARAGASYESSAIPAEYLSVMTVDVPKITIGAGLGLILGPWRFDVVYAHVFGAEVDVDAEDARVPLQVPIQANQTEPHYINGGTYNARAHIVGAGFRYAFDGPETAEPGANSSDGAAD